MTTDRSSADLHRPRAAPWIAVCAAPGTLGKTVTAGCLLALFLANLGFFGERPEVPLGYTLILLAGAAEGIVIPAVVAALALDTARQRILVAALMTVVLALCALSMTAVLGV